MREILRRDLLRRGGFLTFAALGTHACSPHFPTTPIAPTPPSPRRVLEPDSIPANQVAQKIDQGQETEQQLTEKERRLIRIHRWNSQQVASYFVKGTLTESSLSFDAVSWGSIEDGRKWAKKYPGEYALDSTFHTGEEGKLQMLATTKFKDEKPYGWVLGVNLFQQFAELPKELRSTSPLHFQEIPQFFYRIPSNWEDLEWYSPNQGQGRGRVFYSNMMPSEKVSLMVQVEDQGWVKLLLLEQPPKNQVTYRF